MNKNLHRLIFNAARGMRIAVSETANGHGKGQGDGPGKTGVKVKSALSATVLTITLAACAFAAIALCTTAGAQIVADPTAPGNQRPTVLAAPNGVPLVNIQTPSAAGVSRNTYSQFDVNAQGAILNNARTNAQTQLGGWVQGNPWLAGGAARVILNEVNSSNPSQLRGFVEVGGSRAEVVIANPAGVNINGGGFINASRATITTGTPVMNGGNLEGYVVQKGLVSINGAGLDGSQTDFTGIIARAVEVNAGIWANELKVTLGANQVDVAQSAAAPIAGSGAAPAFALDVSQLGGMYAGKITLVGTEAGVGVRNAGTLGATAGNVMVTVDGLLQNSGRITSSAATRLDASGGISNTASGTIYASGDTSLSTVGNISNAGQIAAQGNTTLAATGAGSQISSAAGSVLAAGLQEGGTFAATSSATGKLTLGATQSIAALGKNLSSGEQSISAAGINISGSQTSADSLSLAAGAGGVDAGSAAIGVTQALAINTTGLLRTDSAAVSAGQLGITAQDMSNVAGEIIQTGPGDTRLTVTGAINNTGGRIASNGNTRISAQSLLNQGGSVQAAGAAHLDIITLDALDNSAGGRLTADGNTTLAAGSLNNSMGQIQAGGSLATTASGAINNTQGLMVANGALTLSAASLDNTRGTIASVLSGASTTTTGATINDSGRIEAAGSVALVNAGLSNAVAAGQSTGGSISGQQVNIDTNSQAFNNTSGTVTAGQGATLNTGALNNNAGLIQAGGALLINTHGQALTNTNAASHASGLGGISAQGAVTLQAADIYNAAGFIGAQGALDITGAAITNTAGGQIIGESTVAVSATAFDNRGGQVQALGSVSVDAGTGTVNNTASLIRSADTVSLSAATVTNSNTSGTDQGIEGQSVIITADTIANNSGAIRASGDATVNSSASINNNAGLISAGNVATLRGSAGSTTLAITNSAGTIIADQGVVVAAASLGGDGKVLSKGDLAVTLTTDFNNSGEITANRNASIETTGTLTNQGKLLAGQGLTVKAGTLNNQATGEIRGNTVKLIATNANTLTNRGLIDGVETVIETVTLNNLGTGRIYGDHVAIGAATVNNLAEGGVAPVIAARNRLDIAATSSINNSEHALIFSGGDMAIGGSLDGAKRATGQTGTLNNASATIEALGNLTLGAGQLNNTNNHFSTQVVPVSNAVITEFQGSGSGVRYLAGTPGLTTFEDESLHLATPDGGRYESWSMYQYNRSISETVVTASDPSQILAGGSITINATNVFNDKSRIIAGGALGGSVSSLVNTEAAGERVINDSGGVTSYWRNRKRGRDDTGTSSAAYNPATVVQGISLTPTVYQQNTAPTGSGTTLAGVALGSVNASTSATGAANAAARPGAMIQVTSAVGAGTQVVRTLQINTTLPNNSLFRVNPNPGSHYFVETDPRFASYRQWLSSDYLLSALSLDPAVTQKRLGDGFYEQKLIREQVAQLTGRRFLDGYASDEAQYQALMQSGVTLAQQYQLRPGIALSAAQMAQLTSDIVWLVERDVTLPDGTVTKALVPQLYVRVKEGDLTGDGALISANAVNFNMSGDLTNSGTIAGRTVVSLNAQNIHNLAGRIRGADVTVAATQDLHNIGGQIIATDSLVATAGRDLNVTSTTRTQTGGTGSRTNIDRVAGLYVTNPGGTLVASAGRDINLVAAQILNNAPTAAGQPAGSTLIAAGRDLNLGTVTEASNNNIVWNANNFRKDSQSQEVGTSIQTAGNLQLSAGNDLNARAASVQAQGTLTLSAGNDIKLLAGQNTQSLEENHQHTSKGFLSKKTTTTTATLDDATAQVTSLKGKTVTVLAGNDALLEGTKITAQGDALVFAGNNVIAAAAHDSHSQSSSTETYKRGLSLSFGLIGAQIGTRGGGTAKTEDTTTARGVEVTSAQGNASLAATGTALLEGAQISAPQGTASVQGANVLIQAGVNTSSTSTTKTERGAKIDAIGFSNPSEGIGRKLQEMARQEQTSLARSTLTGQNVNITATQGDLRIAGTTVTTPGTLSLTVLGTAGTLHLDGQQTETVSSLQSFGKDLMYQKMRDQGSIEQTTQYNQFNANVVQFSAPKITAQIGSKDSALQLAQQPGMDWVGQLMNEPTLKDKVDWKAIEDASKSWDYKKQGLTPEGAAVVTIVVAFFTYGAASGAGGAVASGAGMTTTTTVAGVTTTTLTTAGAIVAGATTAALTTLASQAAVSLINNQGDIGKVLDDLGSSANTKALLTAMVTGGVLAGMNFDPTGAPTVNGGAQTFTTQLGQNLKAGVAKSLISTAINGGSLEDSLKGAITSAFIDTAAAQGADWIGGMKQAGTFDAFTHKLAHAIAGCAAGAARSGSEGCAAGAIGAAIGEIAAEAYGRRPDTAQFAGMISAIAAAVAGGNAAQINLANQAGANAAANNYLKHAEALRRTRLQQQLDAGTCGTQCKQDIADLNAQDEARNKQLAACQGKNTPDCNTARQDVRSAAADYIRNGEILNTRGGIYAQESIETTQLAYATINNKSSGVLVAVVDMAKEFVSMLETGYKAKDGDPAAIQQVVASSKAMKEFLSDTSNLPYLMGFMTPVQLQKFATAVENNDGTTVGKMLTDQTLALVGTISTVGGAVKVTTLTGTALRDMAIARNAADVLSKAEYVVAGVPSSFGQSGAITSGVYRIETVTPEMRTAFKDVGYLDPRDNVFKPAPAGEAMAVDHIYPSSKIVERPGFDQLTKEQMTNILQDKVGLGNLQPMPTSLNASKGAQLGWESGFKGEPINPDYLVALKDKQITIRVKIDAQIGAYLQANKVGLK